MSSDTISKHDFSDWLHDRPRPPRFIPLERCRATVPEISGDIIDLRMAVEKFTAIFPLMGAIVDLHYYGGLEYEEIARRLRMSRSAVANLRVKAVVYLRCFLIYDDPRQSHH